MSSTKPSIDQPVQNQPSFSNVKMKENNTNSNDTKLHHNSGTYAMFSVFAFIHVVKCAAHRKHCVDSAVMRSWTLVKLAFFSIALVKRRGDWFFAARLIEGLLGLIFAQLPRAEG